MTLYGNLSVWANYITCKSLYVNTFSLMPQNETILENKLSLNIITLK